MPTVSDETQMLKWMFQPSTTFITTAMAYMLTPDIRMVITAKEIGAQAAGAGAVAELQIAGDGVRLRDVVKRHHHDAQEHHGGDGADPIPVRGQDAVLIGRAGPAQQFERSEIGGEKAQACDPGGHFAAGHEEILAAFGEALQVEADGENGEEIDRDDRQIDAALSEIMRPGSSLRMLPG